MANSSLFRPRVAFLILSSYGHPFAMTPISGICFTYIHAQLINGLARKKVPPSYHMLKSPSRILKRSTTSLIRSCQLQNLVLFACMQETRVLPTCRNSTYHFYLYCIVENKVITLDFRHVSSTLILRELDEYALVPISISYYSILTGPVTTPRFWRATSTLPYLVGQKVMINLNNRPRPPNNDNHTTRFIGFEPPQLHSPTLSAGFHHRPALIIASSPSFSSLLRQ
jgi:hypothetical protein